MVEGIGKWVRVPLDIAPDQEIIAAAVADPKTRPLVVALLQELGWTVTPPENDAID